MTKTKLLLSLVGLIMMLGSFFVIQTPDNHLHIIACDVGQGDATLVILGDTQILIDGGPGNKVLQCLGEHVPFWDKHIEMIVITHPQADHYEGLIVVFENYSVGTILKSGLDASTQSYQVLENQIQASGTQVMDASTTPKLRVGMMYLDTLHPSSDYLEKVLGVSESEIDNFDLGNNRNFDPNQASVVLKLSYDRFDALFTGDISPKESDVIADRIRSDGATDFEYIKVPHHGSKNGISEKLLRIMDPEIATISSGSTNSYGHPHEEVLDLLARLNIRLYRTDTLGHIEIVSDGESFWVE